jgi:hypothetical protein
MKKVISMMAVVAFLFAANVNAQETQKKEGEKKECCAKGKKCSKDKKSCDKDKKAEEKKS